MTAHQRPAFRPEHDDHAIVELVAFFGFPTADGSHLSADVLKTIRAEFKRDFPRHEPLTGIGVRFTNGVAEHRDLPGMQLSRMQADGNHAALAHISEDTIAIHYTEYNGWEAAASSLSNDLNRIFKHLPRTMPEPIIVGLKVLDRFIWEDDGRHYEASDLFQANSELLHPRAFRSSKVWHCHSGWYAPQETYPLILNQLNVDAGFALVDGEERPVTSIDHTASIASGKRPLGGSPAAFIPIDTDGMERLKGLLTAFHNLNKQVLQQLLTPEMQQRISL